METRSLGFDKVCAYRAFWRAFKLPVTTNIVFNMKAITIALHAAKITTG